MKKVLSCMVVAVLMTQGAWALISVPRDFPTSYIGSNGEVGGKAQLPSLVAYYQNDVVLLANPEKQYSETIQKTTANPDLVKQLEAAAKASGGKLSEEALANAVTAMVQKTPDLGPQIVASALYILGDIPGGLSGENREMIAKAAILGMPDRKKDTPLLTARIIGVALRGTENGSTPGLVRTLRAFAIAGLSNGETESDKLADVALDLDEAMMAEGIVSPYGATEDFLRLARERYRDGGIELVGGDGGSGIGFGGFGGSAGSGNGGNGGPTPTPNPTPTPTPTPEPSPSS